MKRNRAGDWKERAMEAIRQTGTKYISHEMLRHLEKGIAARVPVKEFRKWMAQTIHEHNYNVPTGRPLKKQKGDQAINPTLTSTTTKRGREVATAEGHEQAVRKKIQRWLRDD